MGKERLILTGWGWTDYAAAAAVALRHDSRANVLGMSTRRLPEFLHDATEYREIIILGIGLNGNPELLGRALERLADKKVKVSWISILPPPEHFATRIFGNLEMHYSGKDVSLTEAVAEVFGLDASDLLPLLAEPVSAAWKEMRETLAAAQFHYRCYQDEQTYPQVIRQLSEGGNRKATEFQGMLDHYRLYGRRELLGKSQVMLDLRDKISRIAERDRARVLICGESGTGKETVALLLHNKSARRNESFISFNCASVSPHLLESRFLGHEKGAFTGADKRTPGVFELANGGTLFLDEIGELPPDAQGILLRVLEGGRFSRVGGGKDDVVVDVRVIAATNRDLARMVHSGEFRADLFYRLNVVRIRVPALREHKEDIPQIANEYWLRQHRRRLDETRLEALMDYDYPGNVRELLNLLERASVLGEDDFAKLVAEHREDNPARLPSAENVSDAPDNLEEMTRLHVRRVVGKHGGNLTKAATSLGVSRNTAVKYLRP